MANAASFDSTPLSVGRARALPRSPVAKPETLDAIALGAYARVVALRLEDDMVAWLRAVGIAEGEEIVLLRRAAFGGPIHIRTSTGGEFALARSLARAIGVHLVDELAGESAAE